MPPPLFHVDAFTDRRFVDNGRVVCSAGIAAGIDMSLHVVGRLMAEEVANETARQMEYPWNPNP
jgi:transcriptional regulator GlxA family with amidase domain